jgi:hypothetical protein
VPGPCTAKFFSVISSLFTRGITISLQFQPLRYLPGAHGRKWNGSNGQRELAKSSSVRQINSRVKNKMAYLL